MSDAERVPPHSQEAEVATLGAALLMPEALDAIEGSVRPADFYRADHRAVFVALQALRARGDGIDVLTLKEQLRRAGEGGVADNGELLMALGGAAPSVGHAEHYAKIVAGKAAARAVIVACQRLLVRAYRDSDDPLALVDAAVQELGGLQQAAPGVDPVTAREVLSGVVADLLSTDAAQMGVPFGWRGLDELTRGMTPGQLIIIGGRPSAGKSTLALNVCHHLCVERNLPEGGRVLLFSAEMPAADICRNLLCRGASVDSQLLRSKRLDAGQWQRVRDAANRMHDAPLLIDDTSGLPISQLRARARRAASKGPLSLIVVDYLQLLTSDGTSAQASRNDEVSAISQGLKNLARELSVPVLALSQLSRAGQGEHVVRPKLSRLRDSGSLEQDADIVIFVHHANEDIDPDYDVDAGLPVELIVAKQRNGPRATLAFRFYQHAFKFAEAPGGNRATFGPGFQAVE